MEDPYTILNIYPDCTYDEAKAAYRKAALMHHPDRQPPARKEEAARRFRIIAQAFHQICQDLGHPIEATSNEKSAGSQSNSQTSNNNNNKNNNSRNIKPNPPAVAATTKNAPRSIASSTTASSKAPALARNNSSSTKAITQASNPHHDRDLSVRPEHRQAMGPGRSETAAVRARAPSAAKPRPIDDQPEEDGSSAESEHEEPCYTSRHSSGPPPHSSEFHHPIADYPSHHHYAHHPSQPHPPISRRSSFSHPGAAEGRAPLNDYYVPPHHAGYHAYGRHHPQYPGPRQQQQQQQQQQLYNLPPNSRSAGGGEDKQWDLGLGSDDFFAGSAAADRFGMGSSMMNEMSSGFDRMMSSAFKGLSMAGPDPAELARSMDGGQNCAMRMRQSKMVMGRTDDGSWAGKRMEKQMNMANGRLEVNENAQDIRVRGRPGGSTQYPPTRDGNMRGTGEDWDPPPAYQGGVGDEEYFGPEGYQPTSYAQHGAVRHGGGYPAAAMLEPEGYEPMSRVHGHGHGEMVPSLGRRGSVSRVRNGPPDGYPDEPGRLQRRPSYAAPDLAHSARAPPMVHPGYSIGAPPIGRSLARRASGEVFARY
ncbi:hypothetical protein PCANC_17308 [Puccinia coronata f. sp. avenae]|uniref:J domain-containing protein n=1 Tax=Puccinia coronata f. sp. avenae TaxID=200324 RepID=A0A2N5VPC2_9BASI|nr:hypothetical protein PCANC_17308 [Puccinia coronata f. sp. avenae]PLW51832.1 hypothetical protein PCASD_00849 [Puccinia coronata f. sp. avenae]